MNSDNFYSASARNLPGFLKKSFAMFYGGGEIWFEHLDGIGENESLVLEKLENDAPKFSRPSATSLICFNLDETAVTDAIILAISDKLINTKKYFTRVCFVGTDRRLKTKIKKSLNSEPFALHFENDFEKAKQWLVSEGA